MIASTIRHTLLLTLPMLAFGVQALTPSQVFDKVKDSVVVVKTLDAMGKIIGQGSGVLLPTGKIGTNCHVVRSGVTFQVGGGKAFIQATLWGSDEDKDICLLEASGLGAKPVQLGQAMSLKVGEPVYAVGAPRGLELSLSDGIVSQLRGGPPPLIQTTAAISPGSSGGGLFDAEGRLVGFTALYIEGGQSLNFAMPVEWAGEIQPGKKAVQGRSEADWYKRAIALEDAENWTALRDWCQRWTRAQPENYSAWFYLGLAHLSLQRHAEAIKAYREALRINPKSASTWSLLGRAYTKLQRHTEAIDAYQQAVRVDPENAGAWDTLGHAYSELKLHAESAEAYRQSARIDPKIAGVWVLLGFEYRELKRHSEAIDVGREAVRLDPKDAEAWTLLGLEYSDLQRYAEAIDAYREATRINPKSAWSLLGSAYTNLQRHTEAIEAYRQAVRVDPADANLWNLLGHAYSTLARHAEAIEAYREAVRIDPENEGAWYSLGSAYSDLKRHADAISSLRQAVRIDPNKASVWILLGYTYSVLKRHPEAISSLREAVRIDPKNTKAWLQLVVAYEMSGNRSAAMEAITELRRIDPAQADKLSDAIVLDDATSSKRAGWVEVGTATVASGNTFTTYANPASIRKSGIMVKMWNMNDFKVAQVKEDKRYMSSKSQVEYDCKELRSRMLAFSWYSENMGHGAAAEDSNADFGKWKPVSPDSIGASLWKFACGKIKLK